MLEIADIRDEESLKAWLDELSESGFGGRQFAKKVANLIALRAALRVFPRIHKFKTVAASVEYLCVFRCALVCHLSLYTKTELQTDIGKATTSLRKMLSGNDDISRVGKTTALDVADAGAALFAQEEFSAYSARAASPFSFVAGERWNEIRADCFRFAREKDLSNIRLWTTSDNPLNADWLRLLDFLPRSKPGHDEQSARGAPDVDWGFWIDWYEAILEGKEQDWDMLLKIVQAPEKDDPETGEISINWSAHPREVNQAINRIVALHQSGKRTAVEKIVAVPATQTLEVQPQSDLPDQYLQDTINRLEDAFDIFKLDQPESNQYTALGDVQEILNKALTKYPTSPQRLYDTCISVVRIVRDMGLKGECPAAEKDPKVLHLFSELGEAASDIYRNDTEVKKFTDGREETAEPGAERPDFSEALAELEPVIGGLLSEEMKEDVDLIASPQTPWIVRRHAIYRFSVRLFRIVSWPYTATKLVLDEVAELAEKLDKLADSKVILAAIGALLYYF